MSASGADRPRGLGEQFGQTRASFMALMHAHIDLLRAEISEILGVVKQIAAGAGIALVFAFLMANMLYIGGFLFTGEWLFGSMGWGFAQGVLLALAVIVIALLTILGVRARTFAVAFLLSVLIGVVAGVVIGLNWTYNGADYIAGQLAEPFNTSGFVAALTGAVIGALLFIVVVLALGGRLLGALGGMFMGVLIGALVGWLMGGAPWTWPPAAGFALTFGLALWPILCVVLGWRGIDLEKRFGGLYPRQSIEAANETKAWLEEQWRTRRPKLGAK